MIPWKDLDVCARGKPLTRGTYPWKRALTLWRLGRSVLSEASVTHGGAAVSSADVAWDGWQDQPPRASGTPGVTRARPEKVTVRVSAEELARMELLASASGESVPSRLRRKGLEG